ncbi:NifU family protein [Anoxynatronum buryatiense]|uniref:Fe-S cluster biogenesis protein NfuA, 4Fe-4S-binding domain n=1 Tax=Anoxynatronum buryatiense TaxID=489973 RepID=A0AA45WWJ5_9CLOT|nr:NifU family protein [Anoxynatronum buryatiense]SMP58942.1 Fe-S cluster biogenesis protein NfuA, 4Fe-4S-binding domain [Anoxynatronum buryatiense]
MKTTGLTEVNEVTEANETRKTTCTTEVIETILNEQVRPRLQSDGGDVELVSWDSNTKEVILRLRGQCCSCPHSQETIDRIVVKELQEHLPEAVSIRVETGLSEDLLALARDMLNRRKAE